MDAKLLKALEAETHHLDAALWAYSQALPLTLRLYTPGEEERVGLLQRVHLQDLGHTLKLFLGPRAPQEGPALEPPALEKLAQELAAYCERDRITRLDITSATPQGWKHESYLNVAALTLTPSPEELVVTYRRQGADMVPSFATDLEAYEAYFEALRDEARGLPEGYAYKITPRP